MLHDTARALERAFIDPPATGASAAAASGGFGEGDRERFARLAALWYVHVHVFFCGGVEVFVE